jgi:hypothetical protein
LVSATSDIEIPDTHKSVPTILDFIQKTAETNLSMKMVVSKKRKRQNRKFIQLDLFIEITVGIVFCNIVMLQNVLVIKFERKGLCGWNGSG